MLIIIAVTVVITAIIIVNKLFGNKGKQKEADSLIESAFFFF